MSDEQYSEAMGQLIVLLEPSDGPTSPTETEAAFAAAAGTHASSGSRDEPNAPPAG